MVDIIVYSYEMAPNPQKLFAFLAYYSIPYKYVEVSNTWPRPELQAMGIKYRRAPLLSIDSDMYVDTALIIEKLADIAAHTSPEGDIDTRDYVAYDAMGQNFVGTGVSLIPAESSFWSDPVFAKDRSELFGGIEFSAEAYAGERPGNVSAMLSYLALVERKYLKNQTFVLGGTTPTTADLYVYWSCNWALVYFGAAKPEVSRDSHATIFKWLDNVAAFLHGRAKQTKVTWEDAKAILMQPPKHEYAKFVHHDEENPLGLKRDQHVTVTPTDTATNHPQPGTLISLNSNQVCLRNEAGLVMHFPRIGYVVKAAAAA